MSSVLSSSPAAVRSTPRQPRQLIPGEVAIAAVDAFRLDLLRVQVSSENAEHAV